MKSIQVDETSPLRCSITGNLCGTDTWQRMQICSCSNCHKWIELHERETMKITKKEFDEHARNKNFQDGPYIEDVAHNAPYTPYLHLKGILKDGVQVESSTDPNWMVPTEHEMLVETTDALRILHDLQNGPPLIKWEKEWESAMKQTMDILKIVELYLEEKRPHA